MANRTDIYTEGERTLSLRPVSGGPATPDEPSYLLVFEEGAAIVSPLPPGGEFVIGRSPEADLRLQDQSSSRKHAKLTITPEEISLTDLDSHNGTRLNGERIVSMRALCSGDVISICNATLVLYRGVHRALARPILDLAGLRWRLEEEVDRSLRYRRPLTLLCAHLGPGADRQRVALALSGKIRMIDVAAWGGPGQLLLLLPELGASEIGEAAAEMVAALRAVVPEAQMGAATCPADGCEADTLLCGARAAAAASRPGQITAAADVAVTRRIGDRAIVVVEPAMLRLYELVEKLAQGELPVLISGETGTGKEIVAAALHCWSKRAMGPLVTLNCAALPENLVESEVFGHEKGAFSGAVSSKPGLLERAEGGTVFLDEIGELPAPAQAKLLRVLETRRLTRLGDVRERAIDVRLVAATNRNLAEEASAGRFRQDLIFRLSAARLVLPPLRERRRELPVLARALLGEACARLGRPPMTLSPNALQRLLGHRFPGNVRELKNLMDYVATVVSGPVVEPWHLSEGLDGGGDAGRAQAEDGPDGARRKFRPIEEELRELERTRIVEAMTTAGGVQARAAELISMPLRTFVTRLKQYNLSPPGRPRRDG